MTTPAGSGLPAEYGKKAGCVCAIEVQISWTKASLTGFVRLDLFLVAACWSALLSYGILVLWTRDFFFTGRMPSGAPVPGRGITMFSSCRARTCGTKYLPLPGKTPFPNIISLHETASPFSGDTIPFFC